MTADELMVVLQQIGVQRVSLGSNGWVRACCPYHNESRPSWGILSTEDHHPFSCFACKASGSLYRLLIDLTQCSDAAARRIASKPGPISGHHFTLKRERPCPLPLDESELFPFRLPLAAAIYLKRRGFHLPLLRKLEIRYHHELNRIMFPWFLRMPKAKPFRTELYGVSGRTLNEANPAKTLPLYGTRKGLCLYVPARKISDQMPLILVEGELDAIACFQAGFRNVAATGFGRFTEDQANLVKWFAKEVITFFDDDEAGRHLHDLVAAVLDQFLPVGRVQYSRLAMPDDRDRIKLDPAELMRRPGLIQRALETAEKRSDFPRFAL